MTVEQRYEGSKYNVVHCNGALESFEKALIGLPKSKRQSFTRGMSLQIERLANGLRMSKEHFPREGLLPGTDHNVRKHFYALKRIPIRGYCWLSTRHPNTWFISHYILKKHENWLNLIYARCTTTGTE